MASAHRGQFGSRLGFILAAAGSAIGLGNIWKFPTEVGAHGGAAFVLVYLVFVFVIGMAIMLAEVAMGRATGKNPVGAFEALAPGSAWKFVGAIGVMTGVGILSFYGVVAGWTVLYLFESISGTFNEPLPPEKYGEIFADATSSPGTVIGLFMAFLVMTALVVWRGVSGGIERFSKILMPVLLLLLVLLAIRSVTLEGAGKGLEFYLKPDLSKINAEVVLGALGQAFFSLSLGMGAMLTYGSYISKRDNLGSSVAWVCVFDSGIAILAGLIIFPVFVAKTGTVEGAGPGLVFEALPQLFHQLPLGNLFGIAFFALLSIAALTSTISLLEVPVSYFVDERRWKRGKAVIFVAAVTLVIGVPSALSSGAVESLTGFMDWMMDIFGTYSLLLGSLLLAIFVSYKWGVKNVIEEVKVSAPFPMAGAWVFLIRYVCPLAIITVLIQTTGVLDSIIVWIQTIFG